MKFVIQKYTMLFPYGFGFPPKNPIKKKVSQWKLDKMGQNTPLFIQNWLFFVEKATSRHVFSHFCGPCYTLLKSWGLVDLISEDWKLTYLLKKWSKQKKAALQYHFRTEEVVPVQSGSFRWPLPDFVGVSGLQSWRRNPPFRSSEIMCCRCWYWSSQKFKQ